MALVRAILQSIKNHKLFWLSAGAPLASVILSTILVFSFGAQNHNITIVSNHEHCHHRTSYQFLLIIYIGFFKDRKDEAWAQPALLGYVNF